MTGDVDAFGVALLENKRLEGVTTSLRTYRAVVLLERHGPPDSRFAGSFEGRAAASSVARRRTSRTRRLIKRWVKKW